MIESDRENQGHDEEQDEHVLVIRANHQQKEEADQQDHEFGSDDVGEDCSDKESVFAFEEGHAVRAVMSNVKRLIYDF